MFRSNILLFGDSNVYHLRKKITADPVLTLLNVDAKGIKGLRCQDLKVSMIPDGYSHVILLVGNNDLLRYKNRDAVTPKASAQNLSNFAKKLMITHRVVVMGYFKRGDFGEDSGYLVNNSSRTMSFFQTIYVNAISIMPISLQKERRKMLKLFFESFSVTFSRSSSEVTEFDVWIF